jgi:hypothetical protein
LLTGGERSPFSVADDGGPLDALHLVDDEALCAKHGEVLVEQVTTNRGVGIDELSCVACAHHLVAMSQRSSAASGRMGSNTWSSTSTHSAADGSCPRRHFCPSLRRREPPSPLLLLLEDPKEARRERRMGRARETPFVDHRPRDD